MYGIVIGRARGGLEGRLGTDVRTVDEDGIRPQCGQLGRLARDFAV
jgi:hypothetical protein